MWAECFCKVGFGVDLKSIFGKNLTIFQVEKSRRQFLTRLTIESSQVFFVFMLNSFPTSKWKLSKKLLRLLISTCVGCVTHFCNNQQGMWVSNYCTEWDETSRHSTCCCIASQKQFFSFLPHYRKLQSTLWKTEKVYRGGNVSAAQFWPWF